MAITLDGDNLSTVGVINSATAKASTSGTSIDFTGIPSGVKRITVMFNGVSTNGTSNYQIQIGSGSVSTTGYSCTYAFSSTGVGNATASTGFVIQNPAPSAATVFQGFVVLCLLGSNTWVASGTLGESDTARTLTTAGSSPALSGTLDRVRITTVNGTDTFDAGSINILYE